MRITLLWPRGLSYDYLSVRRFSCFRYILVSTGGLSLFVFDVVSAIRYVHRRPQPPSHANRNVIRVGYYPMRVQNSVEATFNTFFVTGGSTCCCYHPCCVRLLHGAYVGGCTDRFKVRVPAQRPNRPVRGVITLEQGNTRTLVP